MKLILKVSRVGKNANLSVIIKCLQGGKQKPGWDIWGGGNWKIPDTDHDNIPGTGWIHYPKYGQGELCKLNPRNPGCPGWG